MPDDRGVDVTGARYVTRYLVVALLSVVSAAVLLGLHAVGAYEGSVPDCRDVDTATARVCATSKIQPFTATPAET